MKDFLVNKCLTFVLLTCMLVDIFGNYIETPLLQGQSDSIQMFDVVAVNPMFIYAFEIKTRDPNVFVTVNVYKLNTFGSFIGHERRIQDWTLVIQDTVMTDKDGFYTYIGPFGLSNQVLIPKLQRQAFFFQITGSTLEYNETGNLTTGDLLASNDDIQVYVGVSNNNGLTNYGVNKPFVGRIFYRSINCDSHIFVNGIKIYYPYMN